MKYQLVKKEAYGVFENFIIYEFIYNLRCFVTNTNIAKTMDSCLLSVANLTDLL
jgi:hypothetical protein